MSSNNNNNPYIHLSFHYASDRRPIDTICEMLNRCGKRVEDATRKAEAIADNVWNHRKYSLLIPQFVCLSFMKTGY
ncbi:hypothetical protein Pint_00719 [Pistacia integerrima]|uniref:Uncharacterized protein n=2 Tax=Pistacia TaxID=55512 RepID=A0ACC1C9U8_9ROSI|nr:hypothetical protein Pint_00719 [Pistacia integerrima]KAJ0112402.1 hypothetical protein Patl1_00740 [Pistacia atlantica]